MRISSWLVGILLVAILPWNSVLAKANEQTIKEPTIISAPTMMIGPNTSKQVFYEDLDGDHRQEKIVLLANYVETDGAVEMTLKINDQVMPLGDEWMGGWPTAHIVDISLEDGVKEIAIGGDLCSSDFVTYFYAYQKGKINRVGETQGVIEKIQLDKTYQMRIPGDGTVNTYTRGSILQTWYHNECYTLNQNHRLEIKPQKWYEMNSKVTLLQNLKTYAQPDLKSNRGRAFKVGEKATITLTDDKVWCQIVDEQGNKGWFKADEWDNIGGTGLYSQEVFDGLFFAD